MTTRELINELLDSPMDTEISLYLEGNHTDEYGRECSGWLFPIDSVEHSVLIKFTDWRAEQTEPKPCEWCKFYDGENCFSQEPCKVMLYFKDEPQKCDDCVWSVCNYNKVDWERAEQTEPQTERSER